jgi:hypothetical protein
VGALALAPQNSRMFPPIGDTRDPELYVKGKTIGRLFEVSLPAGDYELFEVSFYYSVGAYGGTSWRSEPPFSLPFTITSAGVHYVGEFRAPMIGKSGIGFSVPAGGYFVILDEEARDTVLLAKRRAAEAGAEPVGTVINIVPDPERAGTPLLRRQPLPPYQAAGT